MKKISNLLTSCVIANLLNGCIHEPQHTSIKTKQLSTNQHVISYFSHNAGELSNISEACACGTSKEYSPTPVEHGYYRILLQRDANGRFLVQNYYYDSKKPNSLPFWIKDPNGLKSFESIYADGAITMLYENGNPSFKAIFKGGKIANLMQNFYNNGQLAIENDYSIPEEIHQKIWYENGKPVADTILNSRHEILNGQFWYQNGEIINNEDERKQIADQIIQKLKDQTNQSHFKK